MGSAYFSRCDIWKLRRKTLSLHRENHLVMIKVYETKEEKKAAFKRSVGLRKVWEDLTSGKMSFDEFKRQGYNTVNIAK